jgi:acyl-CoA dehydrogenase
VTDNGLRKERRGGVSCFVVPASARGFSIDSVISLFGQNGGHEGIVSFSDVRVPKAALVGELNQGFALAMTGVSTGRLYNAARCVGLSQWVLNKASAFAGQRVTFGRPIAEYQGVSFQLADCAMDVYAADMMGRHCADRLASGVRSDDHVAMAKVYATEACFRVYDRCMQIFGGMGLTNEMKLTEGWHQARIVRIADGSSEILRRNIGRALTLGRLKAEDV